MHKSGKGRPPPARRSTVDDDTSLLTCVENGEFTAKISSGESTSVTDDRKLLIECFLSVFGFYIVR